MPTKPSSRSEFTVAIICALPLEYDAVWYILDETWENQYGRAAGDTNQYTTGRIGQHDVVLALLSGIGKANAASAAAQVRMSFTGVLLALIVGVCGALPFHHGDDEIILGDVIVGTRVVQYDFGRQYSHKFVPRSMAEHPREAGKDAKGLVNMMGTQPVKRRIKSILEEIQKRSWEYDARGQDYHYPGRDKDFLYKPEYLHRHRRQPIECICQECRNDSDPICDSAMKASCRENGCEESYLIPRTRLEQSNSGSEPPPSEIHIGVIASADMVMRSALHRDRLASDDGSAVMVEMEGAGAWEELPCIVVKGVCDYADSHKNKGWQNFAAASAAAAAKAMVERYGKTDKPGRPDGGAAGSVSNNFAGMTVNGTYVMPGMVNNGHQNFTVTRGERQGP